jgi:hypothetical protein
MKVGKHHKRAESGGIRYVYLKEDADHKLLSFGIKDAYLAVGINGLISTATK